jgi:TonB family protein
MYFDFGDGHPDVARLPSALSRREGVMLAVIAHLVLVIALLLVPELPWVKARLAAEEAARQAAVQQLKRPPDRAQRFVFVQPRVDLRAPEPPPRAPLADMDRQARTRERRPTATNRQPFSRGNTTEYVEQAQAGARPAGRPSEAAPERATPQDVEPGTNGSTQLPPLPESEAVPAFNRDAARGSSAPAGQLGSLREALRNIERYTERAQFENPQGGSGVYGPSIQFDTKGVEFGPWIRRFIAQIKRNWFVPYAAMALKGHVVITFNVHKSGAITDLSVIAPSNVDAFNNSAFNALVASNPTQPLPPEYPADRAFFTVTFFYNETPPAP